MIVEITQPIFKCAEDENIFFSRLAEVAGCEKVIAHGLKLSLTVKGGNEEAAIREIQEICDFWNATFRIPDE